MTAAAAPIPALNLMVSVMLDVCAEDIKPSWVLLFDGVGATVVEIEIAVVRMRVEGRMPLEVKVERCTPGKVEIEDRTSVDVSRQNDVAEIVLVVVVVIRTVIVWEDIEGDIVIGIITVVGLTSTEIAVVSGSVTGTTTVAGLIVDVVEIIISELAAGNEGTWIVDALAATPMIVTGYPASSEKVPSPELQSQMPSAVSGVQHHFWLPHGVNEPLFKLTGSSVAS